MREEEEAAASPTTRPSNLHASRFCSGDFPRSGPLALRGELSRPWKFVHKSDDKTSNLALVYEEQFSLTRKLPRSSKSSLALSSTVRTYIYSRVDSHLLELNFCPCLPV